MAYLKTTKEEATAIAKRLIKHLGRGWRACLSNVEPYPQHYIKTGWYVSVINSGLCVSVHTEGYSASAGSSKDDSAGELSVVHAINGPDDTMSTIYVTPDAAINAAVGRWRTYRNVIDKRYQELEAIRFKVARKGTK